MAAGGMYDQLAGGFARYSVDAQWLIPHFEKMLYDNALLLRVYVHWWRETGSELARRVVSERRSSCSTEMLTEQGCFAASLDADSEGPGGDRSTSGPGAGAGGRRRPGGARGYGCGHVRARDVRAATTGDRRLAASAFGKSAPRVPGRPATTRWCWRGTRAVSALAKRAPCSTSRPGSRQRSVAVMRCGICMRRTGAGSECRATGAR